MSSCDHPATNISCPYCRHFPLTGPNMVPVGMSVRTQTNSSMLVPKQTLTVSQEAFDAFYDEKWAIFPTVPYLKKAIAELENFLVESGGRVTAGGVNEKIRSLRSGPKSDFTLLMKKGHELTGISESFTPHLSLSLDPDGVWGLDEGRYERIVQSWGPDCQFFKEVDPQVKAAKWLDELVEVKYTDRESIESAPGRPDWLPKSLGQSVSPGML